MPPKAAPRGGARGRGRGRGGASTARAAEVPAADPPEVKAESTVAVGNADGKTDAPASESGVAATTEAQPDILISVSSTSSPQTVAEGSVPPTSQRLESLRTAASSSRSASPAARRGTSTRGKKPVAKPTFTGRRSKAEREALEKLGRDRERERQKELDKEEKAKWREKPKRGGMNTRGRGGHTGAISGPFSLGNVGIDKKSSGNRTFVSGSRATRMKHDDEDGRGGGGGGGGGGGAGSSRVKREDGGYVSSGEDDDDVEFPRQDIDFIEITSDVEEAEPSASKDKTPRTQNASTLMPIRIGRKEHQDRVVGINTEASSTASARILQQSGSRTEVKREGGGTSSTSRKGKGKARDVEITGESKPFRGMWQESDEVQLKVEPQSDDENLPDAEPAGLSEAPPQELKDQPPSSPELGRKTKFRGKIRPEPAFQTEEDRAEWERLQANLENVRRELGPDEDTPAVDANGDAIMQDPNEPKRSLRDDYVYLFQFPPTMPIFPAQGVKQEPMEGDQSAAASVVDKKPAIVDDSDPVTKIRRKTKHMNISPGAAGKLRVHESGRTTLNWGGQTFELTPGLEATNLQEIVHVNVVPEKERVVPEEGGESTSFSRMKGQFIVSPAWKNLLR